MIPTNNTTIEACIFEAINAVDEVVLTRKVRQPIADGIIKRLTALKLPGGSKDPVSDQLATARKALEFYADPFAWKKLHDPDDVVRIPDFYSETCFDDTARTALSLTSPGTVGTVGTITPMSQPNPQRLQGVESDRGAIGTGGHATGTVR